MRLSKLIASIAVSAVSMAAKVAIAAPQVNSVDGTLAHGARMTINGTAFGTKANAAPAVWETCPQEGLSSQWSGAWPNRSTNPDYNLRCRAPIRGIQPPHSNVSNYMAGAHGETNGYNAGWNVMAYKTRTITTYPAYGYYSWYERNDPNWRFGIGSNGDNNHKTWDFSEGTEPYSMPPNWYVEHKPSFSSATGSGEFHLLDDAGNFPLSVWGNTPIPNPWQEWVKVEVIVKYTKDATGWVKVYSNNRLVLDEAGLLTDPYAGNVRTEAIGGFTRNVNSASNWRYFSDMYIDYSLSRVVLANSATYSQATIVEVQPAVTWADGQVSINANLGRLAGSSTIYLFVFDANGVANSSGHRLAGPPPPRAPASFIVQ